MLTEAPDPVDVLNFRFQQIRKLCMNEGDANIQTDAINLVATSSRYGLVFVGIEGGFKVLKLENIFDLNEDVDKRKEATDFPCLTVVSSTPCLLALSADDMTLAVCINRDLSLFADMYDIRAFANQVEMPVPFTSVRLSAVSNVKLQDFMWNPAVVEMYTYCLNDGSLHIHELHENSLKISGSLPPQTGATAVCWSPKGKEVVVGKRNGSFSRYKPTLQEVRNFPPPAGLSENALEVASIFWISPPLFAVVYTPARNSNDKTPFLVFVSTPKGAELTYINFGDVCYGSSSDRQPRYMMHYDPEWKILICVSSNSVESAVIGCSGDNMPVWYQWILDDSGRAEVPLMRNAEPSPLGMGVIYCAQRKIVISDTELYPPMPVLFLLSTSGLLCPFHMLNKTPGVANVVYPSEPISRENERKRKGQVMQQPNIGPQTPLNLSAISTAQNIDKLAHPQGDARPANNLNLFSGNVAPTVSSQTTILQNTAVDKVQAFRAPQGTTFPFISNMKNQQGIVAPQFDTPPSFESTKQPAMSPSHETTSKLFSSIPSVGMSSASYPSSAAPMSSPGSFSSDQSSKKLAVSGASANVPSASLPMSQLVSNLLPLDKKSTVQPMKDLESAYATESTIISAIKEEIAEFNKEIQELKERSSGEEVLIGTKEEMSNIKRSSVELVDFYTKMKMAIEILCHEVHSLKNMTLEMYAMIGDADFREKRLKNSKYVSMLRERSLDPLSARRMHKIQQLSQYLSTQLREVNDKLDNDWYEFQHRQNENKRKSHQLPSAEAVYRTIVNNQNVIFNQKAQLDQMAKVLHQRKRSGEQRAFQFHRKKTEFGNEELGKLADIFLRTKINSNDGDVEVASSPRKVMSPDNQAVLKEFLANRKIISVKPTAIYSPSQSRLCSKLPMTSLKEPDEYHLIDSQRMNASTSPEVCVIPESVPNSPTQGPAVVIPFVTKPPTFESVGGITQGIPVSKTLNKPTPNTIPAQALSTGANLTGFKVVPNGSPDPSTSTPLLKKNSSQSAFTHLVPNANKPAVELPKVFLPGNGGKSLTSQNVVQQKAVPSTGFVSVSGGRPTPDRSFASPFTFSDTKQSATVSSSLGSNSGFPSFTSPSEPKDLGKGDQSSGLIYEDISPPDSPHLSKEECQPVLVSGKEQEIIAPVATTVQVQNEEKSRIAGQGSDMKPPTFFFSPVNSGKPPVVPLPPPSPQRIIPQPPEPDSDTDRTPGKNIEVPLAANAISLTIASPIDKSPTMLSSPANIQFPGPSPSQSMPATSGASSAAESSTVPKIQPLSSTLDQMNKTGTDNQTSSPFAVPSLGTATLQPLKNTFGKSPFTFSLPSKDENSQKEAKTTDTVVPTNSVATNLVTTSSTDAAQQNVPEATSSEKPTSQQQALFGQISSTSTSSETKPIFGQTPSTVLTSSSTPLLKQPAPISLPFATASSTPVQSVFGQTTVVAATNDGVLGQAAATTAAATTTTTVTATTTSSFFGQPSMTQSFFGKAAFGQLPQVQSSVFGQSASSTETPALPFGQSATGNLFSQAPPSPGISVFGQAANVSTFGQTSPGTGFSFKSLEQKFPAGPVFGATKSVFGQSTSAFGQQQQQQSPGSPFGQSASSPTGGIFGQSNLFGGLGGKPSAENANKNVFASTISSPAANSGIFGNQGASTFGTKLGESFTGGSFSSGSGTVAQSGFGAFQQSPQKSGGFGAPAAFGGSPGFGSSPNFGGAPSFGSQIGVASPLGASGFTTTQQQAEGFSCFASSNSPTFGSLASQTGAFGAATPQQSTFGSLMPQSPPPNSFGGGGSVFGSSPGFGTPSNFGTPSSTPSSAFSQWRN